MQIPQAAQHVATGLIRFIPCSTENSGVQQGKILDSPDCTKCMKQEMSLITVGFCLVLIILIFKHFTNMNNSLLHHTQIGGGCIIIPHSQMGNGVTERKDLPSLSQEACERARDITPIS